MKGLIVIKTNLIIVGVIIVVLIIIGYILINYARGTQSVENERIAWLDSTLILHRGLHDDGVNMPENSIAAFTGAIENGYIIELDISMTKDKQLVIFHDKKLKRLLGLDGYLHETDFAEIRDKKILNSTETVPLFSEVLSFVDGKVPLLIEIKNEGEVGEMESLIYDQLKNYQGKYAVQSFNPYTLKWFRNNAPDVLRGQLSGNFIVSDYDVEFAGTSRLPWYKKILLKNLLLNFESRPNFISYEVKNTSKGTLKSIKKLRVPVLGWAIKDKSEYEKAKDEFDNLIVDKIDAVG